MWLSTLWWWEGLIFQHKGINVIEHQLIRNFANIWDWLVKNKLSIHFGENKTKPILLAPLSKHKKLGKLNISYGLLKIKQYSEVIILGCIDESLSGESLPLNVVSKVNTCLKFFNRKIMFLSSQLKWLLCNVLIQPHFDYACSEWYTNRNKKFKTKLLNLQNKFVVFCLRLDKGVHVEITDLKKINWLPVDYRFRQCIAGTFVSPNLNIITLTKKVSVSFFYLTDTSVLLRMY